MTYLRGGAKPEETARCIVDDGQPLRHLRHAGFTG
ncbi:hypothetical protein M2271_001605 [Streptomyces sp. LBL]|nr:hypothetical protein [Streptomyces sp. LBL]